LDLFIGAVLFSSYSRPKKLLMALYAHPLRLRFPLENQEGLLRLACAKRWSGVMEWRGVLETPNWSSLD